MDKEQQKTLERLGLSKIPGIKNVLQNVPNGSLDTLLEQLAVLSSLTQYVS